MPDRFWVGGAGTWDTTSTTNWSATSGGGGGASVPTLADNVFFDQAGTYTVTMTGSLLCLDITVSAGTVTFALGTSPTLTVRGSMTLVAGTVWSSTGTTTFSSISAGRTVTTNGVTLSGSVVFSGPGGGWTLGSALTLGPSATRSLTIQQGTFNTANFSITCGQFVSTGTATRTLNLGSSTITSGASGSGFNTPNFTSTGITLNSGTSTFVCVGSNNFNGAGLTFSTVSFTGNSYTFNGANTFNTLSVSATTSLAIREVTFSASQTIGTLTLNAGTAAAYRVFLRSDTIGTQRTLSVGTLTAGAADIDFRDIAITGAAAPLTGTRFGDCMGNSGITFPAAKTVYFRGTTSWATAGVGSWSATSGASADATQFPLAQDTAIFPSSPTPYPTSGNSVSIPDSYNIGTIDMSARTSSTMTLATGSNIPTIYGNWINGTGTTLTGSSNIIFAGRTTQALTSAGKTFPQGIDISSPGGTVVLQDAYTTSRSATSAFTLTRGTLDAAGYNITLSGAASGAAMTGAGVRGLSLGSGVFTIAGSGTAWNATTSTNLTITGTGTISLTSASAKTFIGGGVQTYPTLNQGGTGALTVTGNNKFAAMTNTAIGSVLFTGGTTNEFGDFDLNGAAGNLLTLGSTSASQAILKKPGNWSVGANSVDAGNNTGLSFI